MNQYYLLWQTNWAKHCWTGLHENLNVILPKQHHLHIFVILSHCNCFTNKMLAIYFLILLKQNIRIFQGALNCLELAA